MSAIATPVLAERPHDPVLDGIRGLAILLVMLHHHLVMRELPLPAGAAGGPWTPAALDQWFAGVMHIGAVGVDLFFVLSGFLITGILFDAKGGRRFFRNFYARRTLRIFPLYYLVVFVALVVLPNIPHPKAANFGRIEGDEWSYWLYLSNFTIAAAGRFRHAILDVSWSLAIEEQFYLLWPLVVFCCSRRTLLRVAVGLIIAAPLVRAFLTYGLGVNSIAVYVLTPCRVDALGVGAWIALMIRDKEDSSADPRHESQADRFDRLRPLARRVALLCGPAAMTLALIDFTRLLQRGDGPKPILFAQTAGWTLWALFFGALLVLATRARPGLWRSIWTSSVLRTYGKYSYALYLFHLPFRGAFRDLIFGPLGSGAHWVFPIVGGSEIPAQLLFYAMTIPLALVPAWLSWNLYEKHFLKLKRFFG